MTIVHYKDWRGNFGDDLNPIFFEQTVPGYAEKMPDRKLYGIGTLLNAATNRIENAVVVGSGYGYGDTVNWDPQTVEVLGVRGPLTAKAMGMEDIPGIVIGDPAMYVPKVPSLLGGKALGPGKIVVAPHHRTSEAWALEDANSDELYVLDPGTASVADYIATVKEARLIVAESLHGAIMAAAFGIPFIPIAICSKIDSTKWTDFFMLLGEEPPSHLAVSLPAPSFIRRLGVVYARGLASREKRARFFRGRTLPSRELERFSTEVLKIAKSAKPVIPNAGIVSDCQEKIAGACAKLANMLDRG